MGEFAGQLAEDRKERCRPRGPWLCGYGCGCRLRCRCRRFLSAMLHGVEAEIGELGGLGVTVDGDYAALFVEFILHEGPFGEGRLGR